MPESASKQPQVNSDTKTPAVPVAFGDQLGGELRGIHDIAQNLERHIRPADVMKMQRTFGNQATAKFLKRSPESLPQTFQVKDAEKSAESQSGPGLQRKTMSVKTGRVFSETHRVFTSEGVHAATVAGGTHLEIDSDDTIQIGSDDAMAIVTQVEAPKFRPVGGRFALSETYYIKSKNLKPIVEAPAAEAASDEEHLEVEAADLGGGVGMGYSNGTGTVSIPIAGQTLTFAIDKSGAVSGKLAGDLPEESFEPEILGFNYSIDLPIPGVGAAYVTAGLEIKPTFSMSVGGTYELNIGSGGADHTFKFDAAVEGELGLELTASLGAGVGLANVAGLGAGAFVSAAATAGATGALKGTITASNADGWKSGTLSLEDMAAEMVIKGKAGAFVEAKLGPLSAKKKYTLLDKEIGVFKYERDPISILKGGMEGDKLKLDVGDFVLSPSRNTALVDPDLATPSTPLLASDQSAITGQDFRSL